VGYKVVFVPFRDGRPAGDPVDFLTGFLDQDAQKARGRPVGVTVDPRGALIVADDLSNTIWRVSRDGATPSMPVAGESAQDQEMDGAEVDASGQAETAPTE
jgi:hypothetical protein